MSSWGLTYDTPECLAPHVNFASGAKMQCSRRPSPPNEISVFVPIGSLLAQLDCPGPLSRQPFEGKIRLQKPLRPAEPREHRFGGQIAAANSSFHRGWPSRASPVARQVQVRDRALLRQPPLIDARLRRKRG